MAGVTTLLNLCRDAPRALMRCYGELSEARDLALLAGIERLGHYFLEGLEVLLRLALGRPPASLAILSMSFFFMFASFTGRPRPHGGPT